MVLRSSKLGKDYALYSNPNCIRGQEKDKDSYRKDIELYLIFQRVISVKLSNLSFMSKVILYCHAEMHAKISHMLCIIV